MTKLSKWLRKEKKNAILNAVQNLKTTDPALSWELFEQIGDGNFGTVYKARNIQRTDQLVAAKKIPLCEDEDDDQYTTELLVLSACIHPSIVKLMDSYLFEDTIYIMLEYCDLGAMDSILEELDHGLEEAAVRLITRQVLEGLDYLHKKGVIHRDIKAGNLLLCSDAQVKIADFGVSAQNRTLNQRRISHVGTPYWMAPEVIVCETLKDYPYSYKADMWSLGITQLELVEMNPPYHDLHPARVLLKVPKTPPPTFLHPDKWTRGFHDVLSKCLVKEPRKRYSAEQLLKHKWIRECTDNRGLRMVIAELNATVTEVIEEAKFEVEIPDISVSTQSLTSPSSSTELPPRVGGGLHRTLTDTALTRNNSADKALVRNSTARYPPKYGVSVLPAAPFSTPNLLSQSDDGSLPGLEKQMGMFKQSSGRNLNSSLTYLEIPQAKSDANTKMYRRTRSRRFVIDGEELVRHTEDIISVRDENKTPYRQRVFKLRKEVEKEYNLLRKSEIKDQKKLIVKWKAEREEIMKARSDETESLIKKSDTMLDKTHKERKKELERKEKEHNVEFSALVEVLKKEKNKLHKDLTQQAKIQKKSLKRGKEAPITVHDTEQEMRLRHYELQERLGMQHKQTMLELETKYLDITREIVLKREEDMNMIDMKYCKKLFDVGMEQLRINFQKQQQHNTVKHEKEQEFTKRTLNLEESELLKQQEVDRKNVPKKIKDDKRRRLDVVNKSVSLLRRAERKNYLQQFKVEQKDRETEIWKEVRDVQREQMTNFQERKRETLLRCRQIQLEVEEAVTETEGVKTTEREELFDQEKRKIMRKYHDKVEKFESRHETNRNHVELYYQKVGTLPMTSYTPVSLNPSKLQLSFHSNRGSLASRASSNVSNRSSLISSSRGESDSQSPAVQINEHFGFLNDEETGTETATDSLSRDNHRQLLTESAPVKPQKPINYRQRLFSDPGASNIAASSPDVSSGTLPPPKPLRASSTLTRPRIQRAAEQSDSFSQSAFQLKTPTSGSDVALARF